jgi:hypothetical protein
MSVDASKIGVGGNILLYEGALSFRLNEYLGLEVCASVTN